MITAMYVDGVQIHAINAGIATGDFAVSAFRGVGTASPRQNRPQRARRHGLYELTTYYDGRPIELQGRIRSASFPALWTNVDLLKQMLGLTGIDRELKWRRQGEAFNFAAGVKPAGELEIELIPGRTSPSCTWAVDLIAADPRIYKDTTMTQTFASAANIANEGNFSAPLKIQFSGVGSSVGLRNDELSVQNEINLHNIPGGVSSVTIDTLTREITDNTGARRPEFFDASNSFFWSLVSGTNHVTKIGGASSITVTWRSAWN